MEVFLHLRGILWFVLHLLAGTCAAILIRILAESFHTFQIVFMYNFMGLILLLPWILSEGKKSLAVNKPKSHMLRGLMGVGSFSCWVTGISLVPLADAAALAQSSPLIVTILAILTINEKIGKHRAFALIAGFIGTMIILRPGTNAFDINILYIVGAVLIRSTSDILQKILVSADTPKVNVFYLLLWLSIFSFPLALNHWKTPELQHIPALLVFGVISMLVVSSMIKAYEHEELTTLMPFAFIGLLSMFASGYIFFGEKIDIYTLVGGSIIILSCIHIMRRQHKKYRMSEEMHDPGE